MPGRQHVDESGFAFQISTVGELSGKSIHVEVPAIAGDCLLPAGRRWRLERNRIKR
jgi:hypothetical protein